MTFAELVPILAGWALVVAAPGPASLALIGTAMTRGRRAAFVIGAGIFTGSMVWAVAAVLGLGAVMLAHGWAFEVLRHVGAAYLLWLALRSARAALRPAEVRPAALALPRGGFARLWAKGLAIHLTNPKAVLFWGALISVAVPADAPLGDLVTVALACLGVTAVVFVTFALTFSTARAVRFYTWARRPLEAGFAAVFGFAAFRIFTARLVA